ncbi:methyltransferase domain-containing protein [Methylocystis bryophila]|nr:methyltransferase domain-containing protein [Methylocystis bryophila]BDV37026.1 hypothetical protein DSM21852_02790 [Methylocystis bryophila]
MHDTAYEIGRHFFEIYGAAGQIIIELGSYNVNGSLRDFCPAGATYLGLDVELGPGVDIRVEPGRDLPLRDDFADIVVSTSAFEHDPAFWDTFLQFARVLKPGGVLYLNAPSNGMFHRYPIDCWRFYPDCGKGFVALAQKRGYPLTLVESFIAERRGEHWNDFVAVFKKSSADAWPARFLSDTVPCKNIVRLGVEGIGAPSELPEDMRILEALRGENAELKAALEAAEFRALEAQLRARLAEKEETIAQLSARLAESVPS